MKSKYYHNCISQIESIIENEHDLVAALANVSAILHFTFSFWWTGFYLIKKEDKKSILVVGPFQGPVACSRINLGKGVCGSAWKDSETKIIENVHEIENHISCSEFSNSEIVVPIISHGQVVGVLDIDSKEFSTFDLVDKTHLEHICDLLANKYWPNQK